MYGFNPQDEDRRTRGRNGTVGAAGRQGSADFYTTREGVTGHRAIPSTSREIVPSRIPDGASAGARALPPPQPTPKADFYATREGVASRAIPSSSRELVPSSRGYRTGYPVAQPRGLPSPPSSTPDFYTTREGVTGHRTMPSASRDIVATQGYRGGFPAQSGQMPAVRQTGGGSWSGTQASRPDFYTNTRGETARGFMPSGSREVGPSPYSYRGGPRTISTPGAEAPRGQRIQIDDAIREQLRSRIAGDTEAWRQEQARRAEAARQAGATPSQASEQASRAGGRVSRGFTALRRAIPSEAGRMGGVAGVVTALPEAADVAAVASDENSTGLDVATQAAEGTARTAGTIAGAAIGSKIGAGIGALGGPFSAVTVPIGGFVGGALGGWLGNQGVDTAIEKGRELVGVSPESPSDRINRDRENVGTPASARYADQYSGYGFGFAPQQQVNFAQTQPSATPQYQGQQQWPAQGQAGTQWQQPATGAYDNNVTRVGNSFYGGIIRPGFTVNGQPIGATNTIPSAQNRQAIQNLLASTPEFGGGFNPDQGRRYFIGRDSSVDDRVERALLRSAMRPLPGSQNGQLTASQRQILADYLRNNRNAQAQMDRAAADNAARLAQTQLSERAANARTAAQLAIDQARLEGEQMDRQLRLQQQAERDRLIRAYQQARTPAERSAIVEQLRILNGELPSGQQNRFEPQLVEVPVDPERPELGTRKVPYTFDPMTGQWIPWTNEQNSGPEPLPNHIAALRNNPSLAAQFDEKYGAGASARYLE